MKTDWKKEWRPLSIFAAVFLIFFFLPIDLLPSDNPIVEALALANDYARQHVILCLIPAFFIAGAISVFISKESVIRYLGPDANKVLAYGVASVSGTILAVCSCTILPLFAGIRRMGAGLGPAIAFLYSGPAINVLAIILTARVLGIELGIARAVGAVAFSIVVGLIMHFIYRNEERAQAERMQLVETAPARSLRQNGWYFASMVAILVFANWARPQDESGFWLAVYSSKWILTGLSAVALAAMLVAWFALKWWKVIVVALPTLILALALPRYPLISFSVAIIGLSWMTSTDDGETGEWFESTWGFAKQILPLLFYGVLIAGALLGRPGHEGLIPSAWIGGLVGGNSVFANLFAAVVGAFMYFATLTEVPILQGLIGSGMGKGPALALLLAGPALSLPSMLVIRSVIGTQKTVVYVTLVVIMATVSGLIYGRFF